MADTKFLRSTLGWLLAINAGVFIIVSLVYALWSVVLPDWIALVAPFQVWIYRPWGLITYMFVQTDFWHLLVNMMWLWAFGAILQRNDGERNLVYTYIVSGIGGGLCFLATVAIMGFQHPVWLIGSSASVMGVIVAATIRNPRLPINLMFFGEIHLKWFAAIAILICGIAPGWGNYPTLAAHIGGAITGWIFIYLRFRQTHYNSYAGKRTDARFTPRNVRQQQKRGLSDAEQTELDSLLERVRKSGYKNLPLKQRSRLFELSNRIK